MSVYQETVAETLRSMGRATAPEIAQTLGCTTQYERSRVTRACRSLLKFNMIRVVGTVRIGCTDVRVYELTEGSE